MEIQVHMYMRNFFSEIRTNVCQNHGLFGVHLTDEVTVHALAVVYNDIHGVSEKKATNR